MMNTKKLLALLFCINWVLFLNAQNTLVFNQLDSLLAYAEQHSFAVRTGNEQQLLAKWQTIAAKSNVLNPRGTATFSSTDNFKLPVNFIPAEAFGGAPGTFRQITLGQQYVSSFAISPQIDIINVQAWARIKSAKTSEQLTNVNNQITKKNLFESIAAAYYNILSLQEQIKLTKQNLSVADSLVQLVKNRYDLGIVRNQDVNNSIVNQLNTKDKIVQMELLLEQQYNTLKLLCDINVTTNLQLVLPNLEALNYELNDAIQASSNWNYQQAHLQINLAKSELKVSEYAFLPTLSLVGNFSWQQNSKKALFDADAKFIPSHYIGLRLSIPILPEVSKFTQVYTNKVNLNIANISTEHAQLQDKINNEQLELDYKKAVASYQTAKAIYTLKEENYQKSENLYKEGVLSTDNLLTNFNEVLIAQLNIVIAQINIQYTQAKININNK